MSLASPILHPAAESEIEEEPMKQKLDRAKQHGQYSRALHRNEASSERCPCGVCLYKSGRRFELWPKGDFAFHVKELGPGWTLYFDFAKKIIQCLCLFFILYLGVLSFYLSQSHELCWSVPIVPASGWIPGDNFTYMDSIPRFLGTVGNVGPKVDNFFLGGYWDAPLVNMKADNELRGRYHSIGRGVSETAAVVPDILFLSKKRDPAWRGFYVRQIVTSARRKPIYSRVDGNARLFFTFEFANRNLTRGSWVLKKRVVPSRNVTVLWTSEENTSGALSSPSEAKWRLPDNNLTRIEAWRGIKNAYWGSHDQMMVRWNVSEFANESWVVYRNTPRNVRDKGNVIATMLLRADVTIGDDLSKKRQFDGMYEQVAIDSTIFKKILQAEDSHRDFMLSNAPELVLSNTGRGTWVLNVDNEARYASNWSGKRSLQVVRSDKNQFPAGTWTTDWCMESGHASEEAGAACDRGNGKRDRVTVDAFNCNEKRGLLGFTYPWVVFYQYICLLAIVFGVQWYRKYQDELVEQVDHSSTTPDDFTVCVRGFPDNVTEDKVKAYFVEQLPDLEEQDIVGVTLIYNIGAINDAIAKVPELHDKLYMLEKSLANPSIPFNMRHESETEYQSLKKTEKIYTEQLNSWRPRVTGALVTFHQVRTACTCAAFFYRGPFLTFFLRWTCCAFLARIICRIRGVSQVRGLYEGKVLRVFRAPEPSDIRWENEGYSVCNRRCRRFLLQVMLWLLLAGATAASYMMALMSLRSPGNIVLKLITSMTIVSLNSMFGMIVSNTIYYGIYHTLTLERSREMLRITIAQLINSLYIPLLVHYMLNIPNATCTESVNHVKDISQMDILLHYHGIFAPLADFTSRFNMCHNWYHRSGIINAVFFFLLSSMVMIPGMTILQPDLVMKFFQRILWSIRFRTNSPAARKVTQEQLNLVYEGSEPTLPYRYAGVLNVFFVALAFAPAFPLGLLLAMITLTAVYWADKVQIIYFAKNPFYSQANAAKRAVNMIPYLLLPLPLIMYMLISPSVVNDEDSDELQGKSFMFTSMIIVTLIILGVNFSGYFAGIAYKVFRQDRERSGYLSDEYWELRVDDDAPYEEAKCHFKLTYTESNPVYRMGLVESNSISFSDISSVPWNSVPTPQSARKHMPKVPATNGPFCPQRYMEMQELKE
eukprot:GEMP01001652.1.p1 GENE.GEMP01001652.1~~GEMP01001652.1.p1  ORF type:complete len:1161 (+),score=201.36 GEMP01001652.1:77-3559(+)